MSAAKRKTPKRTKPRAKTLSAVKVGAVANPALYERLTACAVALQAHEPLHKGDSLWVGSLLEAIARGQNPMPMFFDDRGKGREQGTQDHKRWIAIDALVNAEPKKLGTETVLAAKWGFKIGSIRNIIAEYRDDARRHVELLGAEKLRTLIPMHLELHKKSGI
jgi:hypothetical protein